MLAPVYLKPCTFIIIQFWDPTWFSCSDHVINCMSNFLFSLLLLRTGTLTDECIKEMCAKTLLIPAVEDWKLSLHHACDVCTNCSALKPQTVHTWWYYKWPNAYGCETDGIAAEVIDSRNYAFNVSLLQYEWPIFIFAISIKPCEITRNCHPCGICQRIANPDTNCNACGMLFTPTLLEKTSWVRQSTDSPYGSSRSAW